MTEQLGPRTVEVPAHSYRTCSGCKFFNHRMVHSGQRPLYTNSCTHEDVMSERPGSLFHGNLPGFPNHPTPDWCPFLKGGSNG